ncbi:MAG: response regulator, partial [Bryobacteraceae bacterium]
FGVAPPRARAASEMARPEDLKGMRALVVDDNATNRLILREMLGSWGAEVGVAESGEQALEVLVRARETGAPYALVLLDCRMPGIDGFEVAERLQKNHTIAGVPILMLTSDNRSGDATRCAKLGLRAYLVKPVKRSDLHEAIRRAISGSPGTVELAAAPDADSTGRAFVRVLLAEDSEDNVFLIQAYLKGSGYEVEVAENGEEAVDKFIAAWSGPRAYDLVLMDVQMPVMDGHEATRRIRRWEKDRGAAPAAILALTAQALGDEVQRSLDAGCTAHLTKPILKATLLEAAAKYAPALCPWPRTAHVDSRLRAIVPSFLERRRKELDAIAWAVEARNFEEIRTIGHNMKGSGTGYGFPEITSHGAAIEHAALARNGDEILAETAALRHYLAHVEVVFE